MTECPPPSGAHRAAQATMSIWRDGTHPIWKLAQQALMLCGLALLLSYGGMEVAEGKGGLHSEEAIGAAWVLRELIGWKRT